MFLPNPKLSTWPNPEKQRYNDKWAELIADDDIIIESVGPDARPDWFQGGKEKWTAELRYLLLQIHRGHSQAIYDLGEMISKQALEYIDDIASEAVYDGQMENPDA